VSVVILGLLLSVFAVSPTVFAISSSPEYPPSAGLCAGGATDSELTAGDGAVKLSALTVGFFLTPLKTVARDVGVIT
jgi:hypothetical protein